MRGLGRIRKIIDDVRSAALKFVGAALLAFCLGAAPGRAEQLPLWEAGAGVTVLHLSHYRGSNQYQTWVLPIPYLIYRGDFLDADERRMRGLFFRTDRSELDVSVFAAPPVRNNDARRGMPDLDATFEIGPTLNVFLLRSDDRKKSLELRFPARAVVAVSSSHIHQVGWIFQPNLNLDLYDAFGFRGWTLGLLAGPVYADRGYNRYFYEVDPAFATPERPAFSAGGGFGGMQAIAAVGMRSGRLWIGGFAKWDSVHGAAFEDSPLVKSTHNFSSGIAAAWVFGESSTKVEAFH